MKLALKNKVSLVTGAGQGIGKAIALTFANEGSKVVVNDVGANISKAQEVANSIDPLGKNAIAVKADVSRRNEVMDMIDEVINKFGRIDILVNNAGVQTETPFIKLSDEEWRRIIDTNLQGTFLCSQISAKKMIEMNVHGKIINISSVHQFLPRKYIAHYAASKGGIMMLTKVMALELAEYRINVNCIAPGAIATPMNEAILKDPNKLSEIESKIPLGRIGKPEEVAKAALYLASVDADYVTGTTIYIDGGLTLGRL